MKETELASTVIAHLKEEGYEVYEEVKHNGNRCDIVATVGKVQWAIECKTSLNLSVIGQAFSWLHIANMVSIAVPYNRNIDLAKIVCRKLGIGILQVDSGILEVARPMLSRKAVGIKTFENQKNLNCAGSKNGNYWTPFRNTKQQVLDFVAKHPGACFSDLIASIDHHYYTLSAAKSAIREWIKRGVIPVECKREGKKLLVYPKPEPKECE